MRYHPGPSVDLHMRPNQAKQTRMSSRASPLPRRTMASAAELLYQAFRVRGYSVDHPASQKFPVSPLFFGGFGVSPTLDAIVTCLRRILFGSFGSSGSLPNSNVIIFYCRNFGSVDWIGRPFGITENQTSRRWIVCPVDRWIRDEDASALSVFSDSEKG